MCYLVQGAAIGFVDKLNEDWEYERRHKDVSKGFGNPNLVCTVSQEGRFREGQIQGDRARFQCKNGSQMFRCKVQVRGLSWLVSSSDGKDGSESHWTE